MIDFSRIERLARRLDLRFGQRGGRPEPGSRRVAVRGRGLTFAGHREYEPGDDVRDIDWNVTARAGRPFVKVHQQELAGVVVAAVDVSASMRDGPAGSTKWTTAIEAAALVLIAAAGADERVGAVAFSDCLEHAFPVRRGRRHALRIAQAIAAIRPASPRTSIASALGSLDRWLRLPAVVVIVSDFADEGYAAGMRRLAVRHDVVGLAVGDARERALPPRRLVTIDDVETGARRVVNSGSERVRRAWTSRWHAIDEARQRAFREIGAPLIDVEAGTSWVTSMLARHVTTRSAVPR